MINNSWADGGYEDRGPGPSRRLRVATTVTVILSTAVMAGYFVKVGMDQSKADCYANAPAGSTMADVTTTLRWLPPGYDCEYAQD